MKVLVNLFATTATTKIKAGDSKRAWENTDGDKKLLGLVETNHMEGRLNFFRKLQILGLKLS